MMSSYRQKCLLSGLLTPRYEALTTLFLSVAISLAGVFLRMIRKNTPAFPVAQHFNSTGHSISDIRVRGMQLCNGTNLQRNQREMSRMDLTSILAIFES